MNRGQRRRVLFLCTGNSARSQMSEAWARYLAGDRWEVESAGVQPAAQIHSLAAEVMAEVGLSLDGQHPKPLTDELVERADLVVTVCGSDWCPTLPPEVETYHWPVEDPSKVTGSRKRRLEAFRGTRDELRRRIEDLLYE